MFVVVEITGKQYLVHPKDIIEVDHMDGEAGSAITLDHVLLVSDDEATKIGEPYLDSVRVKAKIVEQFRGEKIEVRRYKSKVRYRRKRGFRASLTKIEIVSIGQQ